MCKKRDKLQISKVSQNLEHTKTHEGTNDIFRSNENPEKTLLCVILMLKY